MSEADDGQQVRRMMRAADRAALATLMPDGTPYVSLVLTAVDHDGALLLLLSGLAQHTRNLRGNGAASLLFDATGGGGTASLAGARVTLVGTAAPDSDSRLRARFLARHPG
jgi:putative heme iron utilization protein